MTRPLRTKTITPTSSDLSPQQPDRRWFPGCHFEYMPTKAELLQSGLDSVLLGWKPAHPIISADTRVLALGSCFAEYFVQWLGNHGFNQYYSESPDNALVRYSFTFENVAVVAQQLRWAFDKLDSRDAFWIGKDMQAVHPTETGRSLARDTLTEANVVIVTLGLSEVWYDRVTGEPLWRAVPVDAYDPARHGFKVLSVAETRAALEEIDSIRREYLPDLKILYTISPVRLNATYRPVSAVTANSASKAILRAALDEFFRAHWNEVGLHYFYFPSYEIATELIPEPYAPDMRHVSPHVPLQLLELFAAHYTTLPPGESRISDGTYEPELHGVIRRMQENTWVLEGEVDRLQKICDERLVVIQDLDKAARERLDLIQRLDAELHPRAAPQT